MIEGCGPEGKRCEPQTHYVCPNHRPAEGCLCASDGSYKCLEHRQVGVEAI